MKESEPNETRPAATNAGGLVLSVPPELEKRLLAWIGAQAGPRLSMQDAIVHLLDLALGALRTTGAIDDPRAAGQAAFATYGEAGRPLNPHDPHSPERADWNDGFTSARDTRPRFHAVARDREDGDEEHRRADGG